MKDSRALEILWVVIRQLILEKGIKFGSNSLKDAQEIADQINHASGHRLSTPITVSEVAELYAKVGRELCQEHFDQIESRLRSAQEAKPQKPQAEPPARAD